jgi:non-specific serine/threonine protein kinase
MSPAAGSRAAAVTVPNNLPRFLTSFVGRESDIRSLKSLLGTSRMVTITGTGGAGKSRLAVEVARSSADGWPDGVWWIELAAANDVAGWLVTTLELPGRGPALKVVAAWLAAKRALLVLDNCEHLVAACAATCQALLEQCPDLAILATSREPIGVPGESRWPMTSLSDADALHLFEARARLVRPDFTVGSQARVVTEICHRLDQLPLAIEMAAARLDMMSERELLANLNDRLRLLSSGARTAPERQQTMTAAIDWSYRLLTEDEARLFRRLAVFQGGFTLEAVRSVSDGVGETLGVLALLVHKSMAVADRLEDGTTRYRLMESHRDYAHHKLEESGELAGIERRHYDYFRSQPWNARDSANFWAAVNWARDNVDDAGLPLAVELADSEFSDQARMRTLLMERLERASQRDAVRARGLNIAARLASRQADHDVGLVLADESLALARELGDLELLADMLRGAGAVYHASGQLDVARRMYDEALALLDTSADRRLAISIQNQIGLIATERGEFANALEILRECVAFSRSSGDMGALEQYLESLANAQLGTGDVEGAEASWREALSICRDRDDPFGMIWSLGGLALVAAARHEDERALRLAGVVGRLSREFSFTAWSSRVNQLMEGTARIRKKLGPQRSEQILGEGMAMNTQTALDYAVGATTVGEEKADPGPLSRREREVAAMVAGGMTNKEIAQRLFIAERTAEGHVERIRNKLGVRSRTEVATWAVARGLVLRQP